MAYIYCDFPLFRSHVVNVVKRLFKRKLKMKQTKIGYEVSYPAFQNMEESKDTMYKLALEIKKLNIIPTLCGMGTSGITLCVLLQLQLEKLGVESKIIYVKKEHEQNHGTSRYNSSNLCENIIVVDDLIAKGDTMKAIASELTELRAVNRVTYVAAAYSNGTETKEMLKSIFPNLKGIYY